MAKFFSNILVQSFTTCLEALLSLLVTILISPFLAILFLLNELYRLILNHIVFKAIYALTHSKFTLVSDGCDSVWSYKKTNNSRMIVSILIFENPFTLQEYRRRFEDQILNYSLAPAGHRPYLQRFRSIFMKKCGYWVWKESDEFDLQNHIRVDETVKSEDDLLKDLSKYSQDMASDKPQWEHIILPQIIYKEKNALNSSSSSSSKVTGEPETKIKCAIILRFHHALMDGGSTLLMFANCMYDQVEDGSFPWSVNPMKGMVIPLWKKVFYYGKCFVFGGWTIIKNIYEASRLKSRFLLPNYSGWNGRNFGWGEPIGVQMLKEIKDQSKCSVQSILASVTTSSVAQFYQKYPRNCDPDETTLGFVAALIPYPDIEPRNYFTVVNFSVNSSPHLNSFDEKNTRNLTGISRLGRLQSTKSSLDKLLQSPDLLVNYYLFKLFGRLPAIFTQALLGSARTPIIFSNAPWTSRKVKLWNNEVIEVAAWMPLLIETGLGFCIVGYGDSVRFCAVSDDNALSNDQLQFFLQQIQSEVLLLAQECSEQQLQQQQHQNNNNNNKHLSLDIENPTMISKPLSTIV